MRHVYTYYAIEPASNPAATAFLLAAGVSVPAQKIAINDLVNNLQAHNLWDKLTAVYPLVGGTAASHRYNLKDPRDLDAAYRLTFYNAPRHSATGVDWDGYTQYADTHYIPANLGSMSVAYYAREQSTTPNDVCIGAYGLGSLYLQLKNGNSEVVYTTNDTGYSTVSSITAPTGLVVGTTYNGKQYITINGVGYGDRDDNESEGLTLSLFLGAARAGSTQTRGMGTDAECAFASVGYGLSHSDLVLFYNDIQRYQTALGRQV